MSLNVAYQPPMTGILEMPDSMMLSSHFSRSRSLRPVYMSKKMIIMLIAADVPTDFVSPKSISAIDSKKITR